MNFSGLIPRLVRHLLPGRDQARRRGLLRRLRLRRRDGHLRRDGQAHRGERVGMVQQVVRHAESSAGNVNDNFIIARTANDLTRSLAPTGSKRPGSASCPSLSARGSAAS